MPKIDEATKQQRLERICLLLTRNARGISEAEITDELGLERRTVNNYLRELELQGKAFKDGLYWFPLALKAPRLRPFDLSPEEAVTLYLGARLLAKQHDKRNEVAETALLKLASVLKADAGMGDEIEQAARELAARPVRDGYQPIFREVVRGYIYRKQVEITYRPLNWDKPFKTTFSTYLIEPSAIGFATYLIGHSAIVNAMRAYKLERIESARLTREAYAIPPDFPGLDILRNAWGIVMGEETLRVVLRFSPRVKQRVLETRWHPSQATDADPEKPGWLRWQVQVADTLDMLPWVRSWGADCEVIEPNELRETLKHEAQEMAKLYEKQEPKCALIAHLRENDRGHKEPQCLQDHLATVSRLTGQFAGKIGLREAGEVIGLLHDLGKASSEYQRYLLSGEGLLDPDADGYIDAEAMRGKIDHSTAGAQLIYGKLWDQGTEAKIAAQALALCIASHHSGLIDCLTPSGENNFTRRMEKNDEASHRSEAVANLPQIDAALDNLLSKGVVEQVFTQFQRLAESPDEPRATLAFKAGLLIRFLLSCVIDADRLDTADFEWPSNARIRNYGQYQPWKTLIQRLNVKLSKFSAEGEVNRLRRQVSQACFDFAAKPKGILHLTVPTGLAKTLGSLRYGLNHAATHRMGRVIYVAPYTSIIDQNADDIREILEDRDAQGHYLDRVVLEHHSNLTPDEETRRQGLLAQNWDAPVVLTTQVQFLEALFGGGTRGVRRMHQLANAVIILDEVQTAPIKVIHMLNMALRFLVHTCGATVVLCTATQPPLDKIEAQARALVIQPGQHIIADENALYEQLKRVEVHDQRRPEGWSDDAVAALAEQQLAEQGSVLAVVNTRKSARTLYQSIAARLPGVPLYHLSTNMCPAHRKAVLDTVKGLLDSKNKIPLICVSTQLIEAGVDIDFGAVIRYLAGLDSIAQAAGRCNRHGKREGLGQVWIVNPAEQHIESLTDIRIGIEQTQRVLDEFAANPGSLGNSLISQAAMATYYQYYYYARKDEMGYKAGANSTIGQEDDLVNLLSLNSLAASAYERIHSATPAMPFQQAFQTAAHEFRVIDAATHGVVVPYKSPDGKDNGDEIVKDLCGALDLEKQYKLLKKAQRFSVNLRPREFDALCDAGAIHEAQKETGVYYLDKGYYNDDFGWEIDAATEPGFLFA